MSFQQASHSRPQWPSSFRTTRTTRFLTAQTCLLRSMTCLRRTNSLRWMIRKSSIVMGRSLRSRKLRYNHPHPRTQSPNYLDPLIQNPEPYALPSQHQTSLTKINRRQGILHLMALLIHLRTRSDRGKKRATPNNLVGRNGTLSCAQCRRRRRKVGAT